MGSDAQPDEPAEASSRSGVDCRRDGVWLEPPELSVDLRCFPDCASDVPLGKVQVVNCTKEPFELDGIALSDESPIGVTVVSQTLGGPIEAKTRSIPIELAGRRPGRAVLVLRLHSVQRTENGDPRASFGLSLVVQASDSKLELAQSECEARGDFFGARGMLGTLQCWKVMPDADRPCSDGRDCQGTCLLDSEVVVSSTQKRVQGHCSRFATHFGCAVRVGHTQSGLLPRNVSFPRICVD